MCFLWNALWSFVHTHSCSQFQFGWTWVCVVVFTTIYEQTKTVSQFLLNYWKSNREQSFMNCTMKIQFRVYSPTKGPVYSFYACFCCDNSISIFRTGGLNLFFGKNSTSLREGRKKMEASGKDRKYLLRNYIWCGKDCGILLRLNRFSCELTHKTMDNIEMVVRIVLRHARKVSIIENKLNLIGQK